MRKDEPKKILRLIHNKLCISDNQRISNFLEDYQRNRILAPYDSSIDPDNTGINWQQNQSKIALASGQLTGIDYSDSTPDVSFTYDRLGSQLSAIAAARYIGTDDIFKTSL